MSTLNMSAPQEVTIHSYASPGLGSVNTCWVEGPTGVVVIDAQRLVSQAQIVLEEIARTGKPVEAIILTHTHPDHVGGVKAFMDAYPAARLLGSQATVDTMKSDEGGLLALARQWLGEDFQALVPTDVLQEGPLQVAGLTFEVKQAGPGEASSMNTLYLADAGALFAADVVCNGMTPFLAEQRTRKWLAQLDALEADYPDARMIYPGHGPPGEAKALIQQTREYLTWMRDLVKSHMVVLPQLTTEVRASLVEEVEKKYPGYVPVAAIPDVVGMNVDGVWAEMQREKAFDTESAGWKFYQRHVNFFYNKDIEGLLASDYHEDAQLVSYDFAVRGREAMREAFRQYLEMMGDFRVKSTDQFRETKDGSILLEATLEGPKIGERKVYDVFVMREGKAVYHFTGIR